MAPKSWPVSKRRARKEGVAPRPRFFQRTPKKRTEKREKIKKIGVLLSIIKKKKMKNSKF